MVERFSDAELILWDELGGDIPETRKPFIDDWRRQVRAEGKLEHLPSLPSEKPERAEKPSRRGCVKGTPVVLVKGGERLEFESQVEAARSIGVRPGTLFQAMKRGGMTRNGWRVRRAAA